MLFTLLLIFYSPPPEFLNLVSTHGMSAIHLAASGGNPRMAKGLLEAGANVNLQGRGDHNQSGRTPLCEAVTYNRLEMVQFLISRPDLIWGQEEKSKY